MHRYKKWPSNAVIFNGLLQVQESLLELHGVGRKVADCVALFSLDQLEAVPIDTHVWQVRENLATRNHREIKHTTRRAASTTQQASIRIFQIACRDYKTQLPSLDETKSLTDNVYRKVDMIYLC